MKLVLGVVAALVAGSISASADAALVYSLTGTVGDSSWYPLSPPGEFVLFGGANLPASPPPPAFTGAYGAFSTDPVQYTFKFTTSANVTFIGGYDDYYGDGGEIIYDQSTGSFIQYSGDGGPVNEGAANLPSTFSAHSAEFQAFSNPTAIYNDVGYVTDYTLSGDFSGRQYTGELVDWSTAAGILDLSWQINVDGIGGEPFSLQVFSSAPEPGAWALMVLGFAGIGAPLRWRSSQRRRSFVRRSEVS